MFLNFSFVYSETQFTTDITSKIQIVLKTEFKWLYIEKSNRILKQSHSAEKRKRGTLWAFLSSSWLQKIKITN